MWISLLLLLPALKTIMVCLRSIMATLRSGRCPTGWPKWYLSSQCQLAQEEQLLIRRMAINRNFSCYSTDNGGQAY
uniref:Secreted protein n=1 Tax=Setaria viridis TaxID=4556 RepID=A0A4V6D2D3_SETVI|nr:hypothetical protein SEVIR_9G543866v2 [Setaria viridis]